MFKEKTQDTEKSLALFKGVEATPVYNQDIDYPVYQEGNFYYLFGVNEVGLYGALNFETSKATLFVPRQSNLYKIWMTVLEKEDYEKKYEIETLYVDELQNWL